MSNTPAPATAPDAKSDQDEPRIYQLLEDPKMVKKFSEVLPRTFTVEKFLRIAYFALSANDKLLKCTPRTVLGAFITSALVGLEPNTHQGHAYLLPFWNNRISGYDLTFIIGYKGYLELIRRADPYIRCTPNVVYEGDRFEWQYGSNQFLNHTSLDTGDRSRAATHAYAFFRYPNGFTDFEVMHIEDILRIKESVVKKLDKPQNSPWNTNPHAMFRKTAIRAYCHRAPLSPEISRGTNADGMSEVQEIDFARIADNPQIALDNLEAARVLPPAPVNAQIDEANRLREELVGRAATAPTAPPPPPARAVEPPKASRSTVSVPRNFNEPPPEPPDEWTSAKPEVSARPTVAPTAKRPPDDPRRAEAIALIADEMATRGFLLFSEKELEAYDHRDAFDESGWVVATAHLVKIGGSLKSRSLKNRVH